jgi:hypothetical protein
MVGIKRGAKTHRIMGRLLLAASIRSLNSYNLITRGLLFQEETAIHIRVPLPLPLKL